MRTRTRALTALAAVAVLVAPGYAMSAAPTPTTASTFQGNPSHTGASADSLAPPLQVRWSATLRGRVYYPVVADGRVFVKR